MNDARHSGAGGLLPRAWRFFHKPLGEKARSLVFRWESLASRWNGSVCNMPVLVRLPFGGWWLARNDHVGQPIREGRFETAEVAFVQKLLRPGMTVLDIGAHHGLYTLLASKRVGSSGKVIAFEPSPRERRALLFHVRLNLCWNVKIEGLALGNEETEANLYVVEGGQTGCNSLRPPVVVSGTSPLLVKVRRLDGWLQTRKIGRVDFIKLDVEGGELPVLEGAKQLLDSRPRPVILAEVQDVRTLPWGYHSKEILNHLVEKGYKWFSLSPDGSANDLDMSATNFEGNFVACPEEREPEFREFIASRSLESDS
jgi:FkbM family methyltransferase